MSFPRVRGAGSIDGRLERLIQASVNAGPPAWVRGELLRRANSQAVQVEDKIPQFLVTRSVPPEFGRHRDARLPAWVSSPSPLGFGIMCFVG